jgi:6-phosphogluconolactonase (cycloisomerase 2 family)
MNWNPRRFTFVLFAIFVGLVFNGCGGSSTPVLTALTVTPSTASIVAGGQQQFTATGLFSDGTKQDETASVTWTSSNSAVATIASGGLATGVSAGTANITAGLPGRTSNAAVLTVTASSTLQSIAVTPPLPSIVVGATQQFAATGTYKNADGSTSTKDISGQVTWASATTTAATISASGLATAVAAGTSVISATLNGVMGQTTLTVTPPSVLQSIAVTPPLPSIAAGNTQQFTATGTYKNADGTTSLKDVTGLVTWSSATTTVATINASGLATGVASGTSVISASLSGVTGQTTLTVTAAVAVALKVAPANPNAAVGTTVPFTALELLSNGLTQPLTGAVTWTSATTATATIAASSGLAQALAPGTSVITATEAGTGFTGTSTLTVVAAQARFGYIAAVNGFVIDSYAVTPSAGTFTSIGMPTSVNPQQVIVHPSGHFLYVLDGNPSVQVDVLDVNSTSGALTTPTPAIAPQIVGTPIFAKGVVDVTGSFLYVISQGNLSAPVDALYAFTINQSTGALTPVAGSPFTANLASPVDVHIAHQTGAAKDYLYVTNAGNGITAGSVAGFSIDPTSGLPTALGTPTIPTGVAPAFSTIDPSGTHLYVPNSVDVTVSVYSIASRGILTQVGTATPITDGTKPASFPFNVSVDPSDTYLYVVDQPGLSVLGAVYGFKIGTNGAVGAPVGLAVGTGKGPTGIVIDPTGVLVAVDNNGENSITPYALGAGGVLTAYPIVTTGGAPQFLTFYTAVAGQ